MKTKQLHTEILQQCCLKEGTAWMLAPFVIDDMAMATNRHILAWTKKETTTVEEVLPEEQKNRVLKVLGLNERTMDKGMALPVTTIKEALTKAKLVPLMELKSSECSECHGCGKVEYEYWYKSRAYGMHGDCPRCSGTGIHEEEHHTDTMVPSADQPYEIAGKLFSHKYLQFLADTATTLGADRIVVHGHVPSEKAAPSIFQVSEMFFLLMPLCSLDGYDSIVIKP